MRSRLHIATDVAAFGIWDPGQRALHAGDITLENLALQGEAYVLRMGADCGGPVDVFVDEGVPAVTREESTPLAADRTVVIRSGTVAIDGAEHFNAAHGTPGSPSVLEVPNGIYRITVRLTRNDDELPEPDSEREMRRVIGSGEVEYYDRINRRGLLLGLSILLLLPVLLFFTRWFVAVPVALGAFLGYFHLRQRILRRNSRYQSAAAQIGPWRLAGERPILTIQLSRCNGALFGGAPVEADHAV